MSEEEYERALQLFSDVFGVGYSEREEFKRSGRDLEVLQQTVLPAVYKAFKRTAAAYGELAELCMSSERGRKVSQKREEVGVVYRQNCRYLVFATRLFLLVVGEASGGEFSAASFPVKVIHELLGSPGTKECIVFLTDLALLQSNRLLADQLFDYLLGFPSSVQNECYLVRRRLSELRDGSFDHQLLSITSNFESSQYFPGLSERQGSIAVLLFKTKNLMRSLWRVGKSYTDLMAWWRTNYAGFLDSVGALGLSELYARLEDLPVSTFFQPVSTFFQPEERWEVSALCGVTAHVLYVAHQSIMDGDEQVEEAVTRLHFESQGYPVSALVREAIKFSILSILLDPADYRAAWLLSLLHLADSEQFSLALSLKFVRLAIGLNPSFSDPWVLYCLLWTGNVHHDEGCLTGFLAAAGRGEEGAIRGRLRRTSSALVTSKVSHLASGDDGLWVPLRFVHLGHSIFQIFRNREGNDDLCYAVISELLELSRWLAERKARGGGGKEEEEEEEEEERRRKRREAAETERSPTMSSVSASPSSRSRRGREARTTLCPDQTGRSAPEPCPGSSSTSSLIAHPLLFRLQLLVWSLKLKRFLRSDGVHICSEFVVSQLDDFLQLQKTTLERDLDLLDELHIHSHTGSYLRRLSDRFSAALGEDCPWRTESVSAEASPAPAAPKSPFEVDLMDWKVVLSPVHGLY